jgi:hypothetical protein
MPSRETCAIQSLAPNEQITLTQRALMPYVYFASPVKIEACALSFARYYAAWTALASTGMIAITSNRYKQDLLRLTLVQIGRFMLALSWP